MNLNKQIHATRCNAAGCYEVPVVRVHTFFGYLFIYSSDHFFFVLCTDQYVAYVSAKNQMFSVSKTLVRSVCASHTFSGIFI